MKIPKRIPKRTPKQIPTKNATSVAGETTLARTREDLAKLQQLGHQQTAYADHYQPQLLEAFANRHPQQLSWTSLICTEFTSLCPKTGQPDFAKIFINYLADQKMVESKSLKLYLFSFRNHGDFHEDCVQTICDDLVSLLQPHYLEVAGEFTPRGGISIFPFASYASKKKTFEEVKLHRLLNYAPGKYTMSLERLY